MYWTSHFAQGKSKSSYARHSMLFFHLTTNSSPCNFADIMPPELPDASAAKPALNLRRNYWLALALTPGLGATRSRKLVKHFGDVQVIFRASLTELEAAVIPAEAAQSIAL